MKRSQMQIRLAPWRVKVPFIGWIIALVATVLTTGVVIAATDPDWVGTEPVNISYSDTYEARQPVIVADPSGQIAVTWSDHPPGETTPDIYATHTDDQGLTWSTPTVVSATATKSQLPDMIFADGSSFVTWSEESNKTFTVYEMELGSEPHTVPIPETDRPSGMTTGPRLAAGPDRLHVVFNAGKAGTTNSHIFHASRPLTEVVWPTARRVYTSTGGSLSWFPALAISPDGEDLHVVWEEISALGQRAVLYKRGAMSGSDVSWTTPSISLSTGITLSVKPDIATSSDGDVHVVWGEVDAEDHSSYVRYLRYNASMDSWSSVTRIDALPVYVNEINPTDTAPRLALWEKGTQTTLCVAWHGFRAGESAEDVLISCSQDGGDTWASPRTMSPTPNDVETDADISIWPSIAFDSSGTVHGVWQQRVEIINETSYYETYYTHALHQVFLPLVTRSS